MVGRRTNSFWDGPSLRVIPPITGQYFIPSKMEWDRPSPDPYPDPLKRKLQMLRAIRYPQVLGGI